MKTRLMLSLAAAAVLLAAPLAAVDDQTLRLNVLYPVVQDHELRDETGLSRLTFDELLALDAALSSTLAAGPGLPAPSVAPTIAYATGVRRFEKGELKLDCGRSFSVAAHEGLDPGAFDEAAAWKRGERWFVWIEDAGVFDAELIEKSVGIMDDPVRALPLTLDVVAADGAVIVAARGAVLEVSTFDQSRVREWLPGERLLLCGDDALVNLDRVEEFVEVERLR